MVSTPQIEKIRDWWLLGVLALGTVWLAVHEPWLACMSLWYTLRWRAPGYSERTNEYHRGLVAWLGIGASWFLLRSLPSEAFAWLPWGWLAIAFFHVGLMVYRHLAFDLSWQTRPSLGKRLKATQGSPVTTALALTLVAPFCPWWGWPVLAIGFYLTWSWLAFLGLAVEFAWMYPWTAKYFLLAGVAVAGVWWRSPSIAGQRILEWSPRGDSFDGVRARMLTWELMLRGWWEGPRFLGRGPYTLTHELTRWATRLKIEIPTGEAHCEVGQQLYEYGLLGVVAVLLFYGRVGYVAYSAHLAEPWMAAFAAAAVMSVAHWPFRHPAIGLTVLAIAAGVGR